MGDTGPAADIDLAAGIVLAVGIDPAGDTVLAVGIAGEEDIAAGDTAQAEGHTGAAGVADSIVLGQLAVGIAEEVDTVLVEDSLLVGRSLGEEDAVLALDIRMMAVDIAHGGVAHTAAVEGGIGPEADTDTQQVEELTP